MSRLRVLLVGRHFWPHGSVDAAGFLCQLAMGLHRSGIHTEVATPRYATSWPEEFVYQELRVHRPVPAPRSEWSMGRYSRHLAGWLRGQADSFDVIIADSIREESCALVEATRSSACRTMIRFGGWGKFGDAQWWQNSRAARRCVSVGKSADMAITKCAASHRGLLSEGYLSSRVERIEQGFAPGEARTVQSRRQARLTLAAVNRDLVTEEDAPVLLCICRMTRSGSMNLLVRSLRTLLKRYPRLRIWLVGDGPQRDSIHETLRSDGVRGSVAMPGSFSDTDDLFAAADFYLQADEDGLDCFARAAVSAELPIVSVDCASTRAVFSTGTDSAAVHGMVNWFEPESEKSLRTAIRSVVDELPEAQSRASELRKVLLRVRPFGQTIGQYVHLIQKLAQSKSSGPSIEAVS